MGGLGLEQFLTHGGGSGGGRRKFLHNWKKVGEIVVWLSTRASPAYVSWNHPFFFLDVVEEKDSGEEKEFLRFTRFVSPDADIVHESQYFRDDDDRLRVPPLLDPFLLLREWLRHECQEPLDAVVFEWENPKNGEVVQWRRGHLARLVDRGQSNWNHSLDTKLEYLFVVVDDSDPGEGPQIVRGTKLLGDRMKEAIKQEMESNGEKGNPIASPYAFKWVFDRKARNAMDTYKAFRFNKARLTDALHEAITSTDFPDPTVDTAPRPGDKAKIRAAMEEAARIDLPWDRIFVPQWQDEEAATDFNYGANANGAKKAPTREERTAEVKTEEGTPRRRKKKKDEAPPPEPERIPCDDCGHMMLPTATKCPKCGAEYEVEEAATSGPSTGGHSSEPASGGDEKCWSCGGRVQNDRCVDCGLDVTDDLPYG